MFSELVKKVRDVGVDLNRKRRRRKLFVSKNRVFSHDDDDDKDRTEGKK